MTALYCYAPARPFPGGWIFPAWRNFLYGVTMTSIWVDDLGSDRCDG